MRNLQFNLHSFLTHYFQSAIDFLSLRLRCALFALVLLVMGCSSITSVELPESSGWEKVLEVPFEWRNLPEAAQKNTQLLTLTPAMKDFAHRHGLEGDSLTQRMRRLYTALSDEFGGLQIQYDPAATFTAQQVFERRQANCLSFSALFIAMAREVGISAYFQEVEVPVTWDQLSADTLVQYRHINVEVQFPKKKWVVDFRVDRFREIYPNRRLADSEALGHYHSNLGMKALIENDLASAFWRIKLAIESDPHSSSLWANMGIIHRRLGNLDLAEASYLRALELDGDNHSAMRNLAVVYDEQHKTDRAGRLRKLSDNTRLKNPYFRYALAQNAYRNDEYDYALELLTYALRREPEEHKFYFLRGLSLRALGKNSAAVYSVKRAIRLANKGYEQKTIKNYQSQLQVWSQANG